MRVCAITVTYGNRFNLVQQVVERLIACNVTTVVVVDNGSVAESKVGLQHLQHRFEGLVEVLTMPVNAGSAGGFKAGLQFVSSQNFQGFIWLLDDDNLPDENALAANLSAYHSIGRTCCLLSLRKNRAPYRKLHNARDVKRKCRAVNSFFDYSFAHWFAKKVLYSRKREKLIAIPYAPYGGMFFPAGILPLVGYPNEKMFLYLDDHDFSRRMILAGFPIFLNRTSVVSDMEASWHNQKKYPFLDRFRGVIEADENKMYYLFRNCMYLENKYFVTRRWEYRLNRFLYKTFYFSLCYMLRRPERIALFKKALQDSKHLD